MLNIKDLLECGSNVTISVSGKDLCEALRTFAQELSQEQKKNKTQLLTYKEVARIFRTTERTISTWVKRGVLVPVRVGGAVLFDSDDVEKLKK